MELSSFARPSPAAASRFSGERKPFWHKPCWQICAHGLHGYVGCKSTGCTTRKMLSCILVVLSCGWLAAPARGLDERLHALLTEEGKVTANLCNKILDFTGFDSSMISNLRGGIPRPIVDFLKSLSQASLVGIIIVGRLGKVVDPVDMSDVRTRCAPSRSRHT